MCPGRAGRPQAGRLREVDRRGLWEECGRALGRVGAGLSTRPTPSSWLGCAVEAGEGLWKQVGELGVSILCDLGAHSPPKTAMMWCPAHSGGWPGLAFLCNSASSHIFGDGRAVGPEAIPRGQMAQPPAACTPTCPKTTGCPSTITQSCCKVNCGGRSLHIVKAEGLRISF